ncbi:hypothetical protein KM043_002552 [Ampulex compressa]|nr:hypothetical protein KM043_002552 [Ampulex compressa]
MTNALMEPRQKTRLVSSDYIASLSPLPINSDRHRGNGAASGNKFEVGAKRYDQRYSLPMDDVKDGNRPDVVKESRNLVKAPCNAPSAAVRVVSSVGIKPGERNVTSFRSERSIEMPGIARNKPRYMAALDTFPFHETGLRVEEGQGKTVGIIRNAGEITRKPDVFFGI